MLCSRVHEIMFSEQVYHLSLTRVSQIGDVQAKNLLEQFGTAEAVFKASTQLLEKVKDVGTIRARNIKSFRDFADAELELEFTRKYGISCLTMGDAAYPRRLLNCYDPPSVLFFKGTADLNSSRLVAIVGTRNNTDYGKSFTEKLIKSLADANCIIVSGLAYGIDTIAHKCALKMGIATIGVVGHGLDTIYPSQNTGMARQMLKNGGLLTEFWSNTKPDKHNFPSRNRVVAGITDATIIVESGIKGGSLITGDVAWSYNRDVFAVPGRTIDQKSGGCNELIRNNKAIMLTEPDQFLETMKWNDEKKPGAPLQKEMFVDLSEEEIIVVELLKTAEHLSIDELNFRAGISSSSLSSVLLNLEMRGMLKALPGKRFTLVDN